MFYWLVIVPESVKVRVHDVIASTQTIFKSDDLSAITIQILAYEQSTSTYYEVEIVTVHNNA